MTLDISLSKTWPGFGNIRNLIIFGDSYSAVGYDPSQPIPTRDNPLGIAFPGITWTEGRLSARSPHTPNWVGHLLSSDDLNLGLLVYDYAVGGDDVSGVKEQIHDDFLPHVARKPDWAPWEDVDTLFVVWVGINDCADLRGEEPTKRAIDKLFEHVVELHNVGARNFLFVDVPPIDKSPAGQMMSLASTPYTTWNTLLRSKIEIFAADHPGTTNLLFSSWETFTRVTESPNDYGFSSVDVRLSGGNMWCDSLHPTSKMHQVLATDILAFLRAIPAFKESIVTSDPS